MAELPFDRTTVCINTLGTIVRVNALGDDAGYLQLLPGVLFVQTDSETQLRLLKELRDLIDIAEDHIRYEGGVATAYEVPQ